MGSFLRPGTSFSETFQGVWKVTRRATKGLSAEWQFCACFGQLGTLFSFLLQNKIQFEMAYEIA